MSLTQRLKRAAGEATEANGQMEVPESRPPVEDPLGHLKLRVQEALFARLGARLYDSSLDEHELRKLVHEELGRVMEAERAPLTPTERRRVAAEVSDDVLGFGPMQSYLADATVTEIMVNALEPIYIERDGKLHRTNSRFVSEDHLRRVIERIVAQVGRRIDESSPMVDARLADGSRVNAIIPPLAVRGPTVTVRKFSKEPFTVNDLIGFGTLTPQLAEFLTTCVAGKMNLLVTGGTGTGKTTMLNVLSSFVPEGERIITIEDAVELRLGQEHVVPLESRPPNIEGKGAVSIRQLVRNALRMRPDRIIVGEVRGAEALDMLQAMNTGHEGSLSTLHANSPRDAVARLETMVLMAGMDLPMRAVREQIASALDLIVHLSRLRDGSRRVTSVAEVQGMEGDTVTLQDLFRFDYEAGVAPDGRLLGTPVPTGIRPGFSTQLAESGLAFPPDLFGTPAEVVAEAVAASRRKKR